MIKLQLWWALLCAGLTCWAQSPTLAVQPLVNSLAASAISSAASTASADTVPAAASSVNDAASMRRRWITTPKILTHLTAHDLGLVINTEDPYSVAVGAHYIAVRHLAASQVLYLKLPLKPRLTPKEFEDFDRQLNQFFGPHIAALALAWVQPYAVNCNSITGAIALGYDDKLCAHTCDQSRISPLFNANNLTRYTDGSRHIRMSMLLAAKTIVQAKAMMDRGVASDHSLGWRGMPPVQAHFVTTGDTIRSVRAELFPPDNLPAQWGVKLNFDQTDALQGVDDVVLYLTGIMRVDHLDSVHFVPGALADHLTSYGGMLDNAGGQMSVLDWIEAGATASYGTVSEPCAHLEKFPHPQIMLLNYLQGATALEVYWRSVAWPQQGVFVGEPLATPFSRR